DLEIYLEYFEENYHKFRNHTIPGALIEYCNTDAGEQQDLFEKIMDALQSLEKVVCADPDLASMCARGRQLFVRYHF
ncbi:hypothetical protein AVEN_131239-1, partial [Araneus ventricosus]